MSGSHLLQRLREIGAGCDGVSRQPPIATYDNIHLQLFDQSDFEFWRGSPVTGIVVGERSVPDRFLGNRFSWHADIAPE